MSFHELDSGLLHANMCICICSITPLKANFMHVPGFEGEVSL